MRLSDRLYETGASDDYTPATDLVFSMLAMMILLLALAGADGHVSADKYGAMIRRLTGQIQTASSDADGLRQQLAARDQKIAALARELADRIREIEASKGPKKPAPPVVGKQQTPSDALLADLQLKISQLERNLQLAQQQFQSKSDQNQQLMQDLDRLGRLSKPEISLPVLDGTTYGAFVGSDGRISPAILHAIITGLRSRRADIALRQSNEIVVAVDQGFLPGAAAETGPDEEMLTTFAIGAELMRALWTTPLPPACIVIEPMGKVRASGLADKTILPGSGELMNRLAKDGQSLSGLPSTGTLEALRPQDQRISVTLRRSEQSTCTTDNLVAAIDKLPAL